MRRCSAQEFKRLPIARRASASTQVTCFTHTVLSRCHSPMVARSLTRRSFENFGAIFSCNFVLGFHPCNARVPEGTVLIVAPWMPSPCEGVRFLRSTRRLRRWSAPTELSRCGSLPSPGQSCTTKWPPERGLLTPQWPRGGGSSSV